MQVISNGGPLCSGNKGSCRRSFDALVRSKSHSAMSSWLSLLTALKGSRLTDWPAPVPMRLTHRTVQVTSNGLCFRALMQDHKVWLSVSMGLAVFVQCASGKPPHWLASPCAHEADTQDYASDKQRGLCFHDKGSCRRSCDASSQSVAFGEYSSLSGADHTKPAQSQVRGDVVNHTIPNKMQRTDYSWCEGRWPIRRVIGKRPLSSAVNMTRAEAMRNNGY